MAENARNDVGGYVQDRYTPLKWLFHRKVCVGRSQIYVNSKVLLWLVLDNTLPILDFILDSSYCVDHSIPRLARLVLYQYTGQWSEYTYQDRPDYKEWLRFHQVFSSEHKRLGCRTLDKNSLLLSGKTARSLAFPLPIQIRWLDSLPKRHKWRQISVDTYNSNSCLSGRIF